MVVSSSIRASQSGVPWSRSFSTDAIRRDRSSSPSISVHTRRSASVSGDGESRSLEAKNWSVSDVSSSRGACRGESGLLCGSSGSASSATAIELAPTSRSSGSSVLSAPLSALTRSRSWKSGSDGVSGDMRQLYEV